MFPIKTLKDALQVEPAITQEELDLISEWWDAYNGESYWNNDATPSLQIPRSYAAEIGRNVTVKLETEIQGNDYQNKQYQKVIDDLRYATELAAAVGEVVLLPLFDNESKRILFNIITAGQYIPLRYNHANELVKVAFVERQQKGDIFFTLFTICDFTDGVFSIEYRAYESKSRDMIGSKVDLSSVEEWTHLESGSIGNTTRPWFIPFTAPNGESVYAHALELIKQCDIAYSDILQEIKDKKPQIFRDIDTMERDAITGNLKPLESNIHVGIDDPNSKLGIEIYAPNYQLSALYEHLNNSKKAVENALGSSFGIISDPPSVQMTATATQYGRQRFFITIEDFKKQAKVMLENVAVVIDEICAVWGLPTGNDGVTWLAPDSILVTESERRDILKSDWQIVREALSIQAMSPEEARAFLYWNSDFMSKLTADAIQEATNSGAGLPRVPESEF